MHTLKQSTPDMSVLDILLRLLIGTVLILAVMIYTPLVPVWVALLAVYPIMSAIFQWDPFYRLVHWISIRNSKHGARQANETIAGSRRASIYYPHNI